MHHGILRHVAICVAPRVHNCHQVGAAPCLLIGAHGLAAVQASYNEPRNSYVSRAVPVRIEQ